MRLIIVHCRIYYISDILNFTIDFIYQFFLFSFKPARPPANRLPDNREFTAYELNFSSCTQMIGNLYTESPRKRYAVDLTASEDARKVTAYHK